MKTDPSMAKLIAQALSSCEQGPPVLDHPACCRCSRVAELAAKRGDEVPAVNLVVTWLGENGRRYFSGLCLECADLEWSMRWDRAYVKASAESKKGLLERVAAREKGGRNYLGVKRPGGVSTRAHAAGCRCVDCRALALEEAQGASLWPEGQAAG